MVFNTGETTEELKSKYNPEGSLLRKAQERMLEMLVYIDGVCKEQGIVYMLAYGTTLGAVRHGGFIPWDDDLDLFLDRKNYKKLCRYLLSNPHPQFKLHSPKTDSNYLGTWNSLRDTKSLYIQDSKIHTKRKYQGLQIDFFPIEKGNIPFLRKVTWDLYYFLVFKTSEKFYPISKCFYFFLFSVVFPFFKVFNIFGDKHYYSVSYGCGEPKLQYPKDMIFPTKEIQFEGKLFQGPAKPNEYLELIYKNYMSLPEEQGRNSHDATYKIWE